jgi:hypothetical protein
VTGIVLRVWKGVPADVAEAMRAAVARLPAVSPVRHRLTVKVIPQLSITDESFRRHAHACGVFIWGRGGPVIGMAAGAVLVWEMAYSWSRRYAVRRLVFNLCHEFAHYESWRDGKPVTERGVTVRARTLLRRLRIQLNST